MSARHLFGVILIPGRRVVRSSERLSLGPGEAARHDRVVQKDPDWAAGGGIRWDSGHAPRVGGSRPNGPFRFELQWSIIPA
jgi:hypothetical protein